VLGTANAREVEMKSNVHTRFAALAIAALALLIGAAVSVAAAGPGAVAQLQCKSTIVNRVVHYCGPATAKLSVFSGVTFRNGTCRRQTVNGASLLSLGVGVRSQNARTNSGLTYFGLTVSGPPSRPTGGGVIAYYKSKRWGGRGVSFKGSATSGTFVVKGINGSHGTFSGSFHC
jgi:hypothetical protein